MGLTNKATVITGAASGIGRSMARVFAARGARLVLVDRDEARLAKVAAELSSAQHQVVTCDGDVTDQADVDRVIDRCIEAYGRVDALCNNAGVLDNLTPLHLTDDATWDRVMGINARGPFLFCRRVLPLMMEQGSGAIVNTASAAGAHGGRGGAAYTASKHAVVGLTRSIAWFYADKGVRCNAIAPGSILTKMQQMQPNMDGFARYQPYFQTIPRAGKASEVAAAAAFLASDDAAYVNGAVLEVDGGWTAY
jgi:NAD(P)-dependent dehydrogenase (short-subunit alcohol dehydrogenase family)